MGEPSEPTGQKLSESAVSQSREEIERGWRGTRQSIIDSIPPETWGKVHHGEIELGKGVVIKGEDEEGADNSKRTERKLYITVSPEDPEFELHEGRLVLIGNLDKALMKQADDDVQNVERDWLQSVANLQVSDPQMADAMSDFKEERRLAMEDTIRAYRIGRKDLVLQRVNLEKRNAREQTGSEKLRRVIQQRVISAYRIDDEVTRNMEMDQVRAAMIHSLDLEEAGKQEINITQRVEPPA